MLFTPTPAAISTVAAHEGLLSSLLLLLPICCLA